jgi:hypothetical protein
MLSEDAGYILTEIWNAKPSWLALPTEVRVEFFETRIGPLLGSLVGEGAEILACAVNDNTGGERMDYRFMAIWKLPNKAFSDRLEAAAEEAGFLEYFDQVNFSGNSIPPDVLNAHMIELR